MTVDEIRALPGNYCVLPGDVRRTRGEESDEMRQAARLVSQQKHQFPDGHPLNLTLFCLQYVLEDAAIETDNRPDYSYLMAAASDLASEIVKNGGWPIGA